MKACLLRLLWRQYRQNRKLLRAARLENEYRTIAWETAQGNVAILIEKNARLMRNLAEAERKMESMAVRLMAQGFLLRDVEGNRMPMEKI